MNGNGTGTPPKKFDAYHRWLGIPPAEQPPDHYRLLGIARFETDPDVIESAADQRMAHLRTLQSGSHGTLSQKLLNQVAAAKLCLLQADKKAAYDRRLRQVVWERCNSQLVDGARDGKPSEAGDIDGGLIGEVWRPPVLTAASPIPIAASPVAAQVTPSLSQHRRRRAGSWMAIAPIVAGVLAVAGLVVWASSPPAENPSKSTAALPRGQEWTATRTAAEEAKSPSRTKSQPEDTIETRALPESETPKITGEATAQPEVEPDPTPGSFDPPVFQPPVAEKKPVSQKTAKAPPESRLPVPSREIQQQVIGQLNTIHNLDGAGTNAEKAALAGRLFAAAGESKEQPNERYVLLHKAMELATEVGDPKLTLAAAAEIAKRYEVEAGLEETALKELAPKATDAERIEALVEASRGIIERAVAEGRFDAALDLASLTSRACQRPQGRNVRKETADRVAWVQELQQLYQQVEAAKATVKADPQDTAANLFLARWYCLSRGDWQRSLPRLAKVGDAEVKSLAEKDLSTATTTQNAQIELADAWWTLAEDRKGDVHDLAVLRAGHWYRQAEQGQVTGLLRLKIEKRLQEAGEIQQAHNAQQQRLRPPSTDAKHSLWSDVL